MNWLFQSSVYPNEPYWHGVRRRVRSALLAMLLTGASAAAAFEVYSLSQSPTFACVAAIACGVVMAQLDLAFDPLPLASEVTRADKRTTMIFVGPSIVVLSVAVVFVARGAPHGTDLLAMLLLAQLLGFVFGASGKFLRMGN